MISRNRGFGLVEIMVGLIVGLISMVIIMQVYSVFEGQKRATTTGSDAQTNGALALYLMEREIRAAGYGLTEGVPHKYPPLAGCLTRVYSAADYLVPNHLFPYNSTPVPGTTASNVRFAPVLVNDSGNNRLSDSLTIVYGTSPITVPYTLVPDAANYVPGGTIRLTSASGIAENGQRDMVALIEEASRADGVNYISPRPCSLLQVAAAPVANQLVLTGDNNGLSFASAPPLPAAPAQLYNLGQVNIVTYRIGTNPLNGGQDNLVADVTKFGVVPDGGAGLPVVNRTNALPLASNIVNMQVQYGVDTGNPAAACSSAASKRPGTPGDADSIVDAWVNATGVWANNGIDTPSMTTEFNLRRIRAVRIGLVARSGAMAEAPPQRQSCPVHHHHGAPENKLERRGRHDPRPERRRGLAMLPLQGFPGHHPAQECALEQNHEPGQCGLLQLRSTN